MRAQFAVTGPVYLLTRWFCVLKWSRMSDSSQDKAFRDIVGHCQSPSCTHSISATGTLQSPLARSSSVSGGRGALAMRYVDTIHGPHEVISALKSKRSLTCRSLCRGFRL